MGILGDQLRAIRRRAIAAGMRLLTEDEIGGQRSQNAAALSRNLKRLREARGWKIPMLAIESGVSTSTIRWIEQGHGPSGLPPDPQLATLLKLARAIGVGVEALVEEGGEG